MRKAIVIPAVISAVCAVALLSACSSSGPAPVDPSASASVTTDPANPGDSANPEDPSGSANPGDPANPSDPANPGDSANPSGSAAPIDPINDVPVSLQENLAEYLTSVMSALPPDSMSVSDAKIWQTAAAGFNRPNVTVLVDDVNKNGSVADPDDRIVITELVEGKNFSAIITVAAGGASYSVAFSEAPATS